MTVELFSVADVARITGLSADTIRAAVKDGELAASKLRGRIKINPDDLAAWIDNNKVKPSIGDLILGAFPTSHPRHGGPAGGYRQAARGMRRAA